MKNYGNDFEHDIQDYIILLLLLHVNPMKNYGNDFEHDIQDYIILLLLLHVNSVVLAH